MKKNVITTALFIALSQSVAAQTAELQPITVYSAYAAPVNQDQTASSVTVLTENDFTARNATYVSDVLKTVPSVMLSSYGGRGTLTNFSLRGAKWNQTAVIIDGVKVNPTTGFGFDFGGLSLSNIDRIEVLRGEQSALWGSDAMGGVIYITTKSGLYKDKPINLDFDLGTGSHGTYDGSATVSGYHKGFYYALHGDSHRTRGISAFSSHSFHYRSTDGQDFTSGGAVEKDKFHRDNGSVRLGFDDNNKGIELLAAHSSQTVHIDDTDQLTDDVLDAQTRTRENLVKLSAYLGNEQELLKHKVTVSQFKTEIDDLGTWGLTATEMKKSNANYQLDVNFDREGDITQAISLLGEIQKTEFESNKINSGKKKLTEKSLAAEYRLFSRADHSLSLSGRYTDNSQYENAWTGRISGAYRLSPNFRAHSSFGSAIQNPNIYDYYGYSGSYLANPNLKPAKSVGCDAGLLIETTDKRHSLDITYFARNVKDLIRINNTWTQSINENGTSRIQGIEIAYNGKLTDALTAYANYTFTRAKDNQHQDLQRYAKHQGAFGLAYQITEKLGANFNVIHTGNRLDSYFTPAVYTSYSVKLPSYTLVNLGANYQLNDAVNLYVNLNNLFDKKYEHTVGYGQDGRNLYVGLKGSF
ncbi:TonB-dependent receptor plug domain-containing protein [Caviibacterium pharyngocola]|uniref:TonB-dependent receptor n=1 Tax=Caviibacterium pharyngocola TaxID=28159 RepID=A0A2M8RU43_9PAST|nr:TonB-dependent receptor [Caviibacterium pharyngocola]PJG82406.1 TonB-dependent receptor [Caviibacterium pharyngocola]